DPEAHARRWRGLPAATPTLQPTPTDHGAYGGRRGPPSTSSPARATTLEGAAAEVTHSPSPRRSGRAPLFAGLAVVALAVAGVVGFTKLSGGHDATPVVQPPQPVPTPSQPAEISITLASDPPGARVQRADRAAPEAQRTPITFKLHRGDPSFDVQLKLDGYAAQTRTVTTESSAKLLVTLPPAAATVTPVAALPEKPAASATNAKAPSHHGSTHSPSTKVTQKHEKQTGDAPKSSPNSVDDEDMTLMPPNFK
ncbi:MAG TPA: hypothetical protein VIA18_23195, partial [Polyangia bacterium]|nr:hypothetical protein [Polyangia bacterium]